MRLFLLCALLAAAPAARAADLPGVEVRERALRDLRAHIESRSYFMGVSDKNAARIELGRCVRVYAVTLEDLARFGAEDSPNRVLKDGGIATCDFTLDGMPKGWIEFKKEDGTWFARWYGGETIAALLENARSGWNEEQKAASFVVVVPGLKAQFAACAEGCAPPDPKEPRQELELKPGVKPPTLTLFGWRFSSPLQQRVLKRLAAGQTRATEVFESLAPEAAYALGR